jgi:hypothetical protein
MTTQAQPEAEQPTPEEIRAEMMEIATILRRGADLVNQGWSRESYYELVHDPVRLQRHERYCPAGAIFQAAVERRFRDPFYPVRAAEHVLGVALEPWNATQHEKGAVVAVLHQAATHLESYQP